MTMIQANTRAILQGVVIWLGSAFLLSWFWDSWLLDGPHGPYRWVGMDFVPFWVGVQEMLNGLNPYTPEVTLKIQEVVYGGPAGVYDPMMFVYPAWLFLVILPFSFLPLQWAVILYSSTLMLLLFIVMKQLAALWASLYGGKNAFWLFVLIAGSLPFIIISVMKGQLGYIGLVALYFSRQLWKKKPLWAGVILGFALIKPTVTVIPVLGFLLWGLYEKNWRLLLGFSGLMFALLVSSVLVSGYWLPEYFEMLGITGGMSVLWSLEILVFPWNLIYVAYFIPVVAFALTKSLKFNDSRDWFSAVVLAGIAFTPMRWIYDLFLGILIPAGQLKDSRMNRYVLSLAVLFPWILIFLDETLRGKFAVVALPVVWSLIFILQNEFLTGIKQLQGES